MTITAKLRKTLTAVKQIPSSQNSVKIYCDDKAIIKLYNNDLKSNRQRQIL